MGRPDSSYRFVRSAGQRAGNRVAPFRRKPEGVQSRAQDDRQVRAEPPVGDSLLPRQADRARQARGCSANVVTPRVTSISPVSASTTSLPSGSATSSVASSSTTFTMAHAWPRFRATAANGGALHLDRHAVAPGLDLRVAGREHRRAGDDGAGPDVEAADADQSAMARAPRGMDSATAPSGPSTTTRSARIRSPPSPFLRGRRRTPRSRGAGRRGPFRRHGGPAPGRRRSAGRAPAPRRPGNLARPGPRARRCPGAVQHGARLPGERRKTTTSSIPAG